MLEDRLDDGHEHLSTTVLAGCRDQCTRPVPVLTAYVEGSGCQPASACFTARLRGDLEGVGALPHGAVVSAERPQRTPRPARGGLHPGGPRGDERLCGALRVRAPLGEVQCDEPTSGVA